MPFLEKSVLKMVIFSIKVFHELIVTDINIFPLT